MLKSLRSRLVLSYVFVVFLSLLLGFITLVVVIRPVLIRLTYATLLDKALPTARLINELAQQDTPIADMKARLQEQADEQSVRILLVEARGRILVDTGGTLEGRLTGDLASERPDANTRYVRGNFLSGGENLLYVGVQVALQRADAAVQRAHLLILAVPARGSWAVLRELLSGFLWAGLVTLVVAAVLALVITRSLAAPIKKIAAAAHSIAQGDYDQRLAIEYPSEMKEVAASFNQMAHDVKQSRQAMRDFVANVSHELKTPLTSIRGFADAIVDGAAQGQAEQERAAGVIRDEALRMTRMVEQLLDLSKIESGQIAMARNPVQADQVLRACVEGLRLAGGGKIAEVIVVGIWNTPRRRQEYMPQKPVEGPEGQRVRTQLVEEYGGEPLSDGYLRFVVEEVKPFVDSAYRTQPQRESTFIMGSSMGGLISLYALCEYPEVFAGAGCLSTHWPAGEGVMVEYLRRALPRPGKHRVYFDHGTETLDATYEVYQRRVDDVMRAAGYREGADWITHRFPGAEHSERAWRERVHIPLQFLLIRERIRE